LFSKVREKIAAFPGCLHVELLREISDEPQRIYLTRSIWYDEEALQQYRGSELFQTTWASTKALFSDKPEAWTMSICFGATLD